MAEPALDPKMRLREDLSKEYYAILDVVSNYDGWLDLVKGWSVALLAPLPSWASDSSSGLRLVLPRSSHGASDLRRGYF